jgi:hypothetical protein
MSLSAVSFAKPGRRPALVILGLLAGAVTGWGSSASAFGTIPWWLAVGLVSAAAFWLSYPTWPAGFLVAAGILFGTTHVVPYGPLGMAAFLTAAVLLESPANRARETRAMSPAEA